MHSLPAPVWAAAWVSARSHLAAWRAAWRSQRKKWSQARALLQGERELAAMSLHGLRDIGAPETLLERRQRGDEHLRQQQRTWMHLRG